MSFSNRYYMLKDELEDEGSSSEESDNESSLSEEGDSETISGNVYTWCLLSSRASKYL